MKKVIISMVFLYLFSSGVPGFADDQATYLQPLKGRLIHLHVSGSPDVQNMMETFLTEHDFILVDDDRVPMLHVDAERIKRGNHRECTVTYHIRKLELLLPGKGIIYSSSGKSSHDYGTEEAASISACHLLKEYLRQDSTLMAKLKEIGQSNYYHLALSSKPIQRELDEIKAVILKLIMGLERNKEARRRLQVIGKKQTLLSERLKTLARHIKNGRGQISKQAVFQVLDAQKRILRTQEAQYAISANCPQSESADYATKGAILVRVPVRSTQILKTRHYKIFSENQCLIYKRTKAYEGPQFFRSMDTLRSGNLGRYFKSRNHYLEIQALTYHPEDHSVIVSLCDADAVMYANSKGMHPDKIFVEGRVVLIPDLQPTLEK